MQLGRACVAVLCSLACVVLVAQLALLRDVRFLDADLPRPSFLVADDLRENAYALLVVSRGRLVRENQPVNSPAEEREHSGGVRQSLAWARRQGLCSKHVKVYEEGCIHHHFGPQAFERCVMLEVQALVLQHACGSEIQGVLVVMGDQGAVISSSSARSLFSHLAAISDSQPVSTSHGAQYWPKAATERICKIWLESSTAMPTAILDTAGAETFLQSAEANRPSPGAGQAEASFETEQRYYTRCICLANGAWQHPRLMFEQDLVHQVLSHQKKRVAIVVYIVEGEEERSEKFKKILHGLPAAMEQMLQSPAVVSSRHSVQVVLATAPLEEWARQERAALLKEMVDNRLTPLGVVHKEPRTVRKHDFSGKAHRLMEEAWNCCGWHEYEKLGAWNLEEYDAVLMLDHDVNANFVIDEVFESPHTFLATPDPVAALNGGMMLLRPDAAVFQEMLALLRQMDSLYDHRTGWNASGPLLPEFPAVSDLTRSGHVLYRAHQNLAPISFAMETNQGFLFWFFFVRPQTSRTENSQPRARMLSPCVYNFNLARNFASELCRGTLVRVKMCHKGCRQGRPYFHVASAKFVAAAEPTV